MTNKSENTLTARQKLKLVMGCDCWHTDDLDGQLYRVTVSDGPLGLRTPALRNERFEDQPAIAYPSNQILANSWDKQLAYRLGSALAADAAELNVDVLLAPGLNIKRSSHCGRNFEYFSEDPLVAGTLGKCYVQGLQDNGIGATIKHYCCNNAENSRMWLSAEVDERTLREIYLKAFEISCKAHPWAVMCSYNVVNGVRVAQHRKLFDLLRNELGFGSGLIMSDWGAVTDAAASINAGLDLIMPYSDKCRDQLEAAYNNDELNKEQLDECAQRVITFTERCRNAKHTNGLSREQRLQIARQIEAEGIVLLKNDGILPIDPSQSVSLSGNFANNYINGGGSSAVQPDEKPITLLDAMKAMHTGELTYRDLWEYGVSEAPILQVEDSYGKDVAIVCVGLHDCEGFDRLNARLPQAQEQLIKEVSRKNPHTVVILYCGAPVDMSEWIDCVQAVIWAGYPGQVGNLAVSDVLYGKVNPSGRLTETFPLGEFDYPAHYCYKDSTMSVYSDGLMVGYRYHVTAQHKGLPNALPAPRFPFGYGLSYSAFEYSDISCTVNEDGTVTVDFDIANTSDRDGTEVPQIYVREVNPRVFRPYMELGGFERVDIAAHTVKHVQTILPASAFAFYSVAENCWLVQGGAYELYVGSNSQCTPLSIGLTLNRRRLTSL